MKRHTLPTFLLFVFVFYFQNSLYAASLKTGVGTSATHPRTAVHSGNPSSSFSIKKSRKGWFSKLKNKWKKKARKGQGRPGREKAALRLYISLGLVVLSIIMFALYSYGQVFSILGSVFAIGAAVFFVLWLLHFMGKI